MRFRLATKPPLRPLKAWFDIPDSDSEVNICSLKSQICSRISQLIDEDGSTPLPEELTLTLDDFELLEDSNVKVVKENETICILKKKSIETRKRKAGSIDEKFQKKRKILKGRAQKQAPSSSSDSSSYTTSSSSESSSEEDSSSESSSESESEGESSSDSDSSGSSIEVQPTTKLNGVHNNPPVIQVVNTVPPGRGKPSTRNRNARRRAKRIHDRLQNVNQSVGGVSFSSANAIPLGNRPSTEQRPLAVTQTDQAQQTSFVSTTDGGDDISTLSLKNKNKKRGFKRAMEGVLPERIVFSTKGEGIVNQSLSSEAISSTKKDEAVYHRLIAPSQKQELGLLPPNMFVTSVEVEGNTWNRKKKKEQRNIYGDGLEDITQTIQLDYGEMDSNEKVLDWDDIEKKWDCLSTVTDTSSLSTGSLVGWKDLGLNPSTFTPELMVHLAWVKRIEGDLITLAPVLRPGAVGIAFGANETNYSHNGYGDNENYLEDTTLSFDDFSKLQCRVVEST